MFAPFLRHSGDCAAPKGPPEIVTWFLVVATEENVVGVGFKLEGWRAMSRVAETENQIEFQTKPVNQDAVVLFCAIYRDKPTDNLIPPSQPRQNFIGKSLRQCVTKPTNRSRYTLRMLPLGAHEVMVSHRVYGFVFVFDADMVDSVPSIVLSSSLGSWTAPLLAQIDTKSHFINTAAMNQGSQLDIDDAHQTLKYTKAKMCDILTQIAADQEDYGQPLDSQVRIVWEYVHLLGLMTSSPLQYLPITVRLH